jgi:hypothetical protein
MYLTTPNDPPQDQLWDYTCNDGIITEDQRTIMVKGAL